MNRLISILFFLLLAFPCKATETIRLTTSANLRESISAVVLTEAYSRLGIVVEAQQNPSFKSLELVNTGKLDGEISRAAGLEKLYSNFVRVPVPVHQFSFAAFTTNVELPEPTWEKLRPFSIGIKQGSDILLRRLQGMEPIQVLNHEEMFKQLAEQKFDICISGQLHGLKIINELSLDNVKLLEPALEEMPIYHYLHKKHQKLIPDLVRVLLQMTDEGYMRQVHREFLDNTGHFSQ